MKQHTCVHIYIYISIWIVGKNMCFVVKCEVPRGRRDGFVQKWLEKGHPIVLVGAVLCGRTMEGSVVLGHWLIPHSRRLPQIDESGATGPFEFSCHLATRSPCSCVLDLDSEKALTFTF